MSKVTLIYGMVGIYTFQQQKSNATRLWSISLIMDLYCNVLDSLESLFIRLSIDALFVIFVSLGHCRVSKLPGAMSEMKSFKTW